FAAIRVGQLHSAVMGYSTCLRAIIPRHLTNPTLRNIKTMVLPRWMAGRDTNSMMSGDRQETPMTYGEKYSVSMLKPTAPMRYRMLTCLRKERQRPGLRSM